MNKHSDYKRTEGRGLYNNKEDNLIYYSYMDPQFGFDGGRCSTPKDVFLQHFVLMN